MPKPQHLFKMYEANKLPAEGGFILTTMFDPNGSLYTTLEVISYANVKELVSDGQTLTFRSDGYKIYLMIEPAGYLARSIEPVFRERGKTIPYRFSEVEIITDYRQNRIMVGKHPILSMSSFTVDQPAGDNFSIFFSRDEETAAAMKDTVTNLLNKDLGLTRTESRKAANLFVDPIMTALSF